MIDKGEMGTTRECACACSDEIKCIAFLFGLGSCYFYEQMSLMTESPNYATFLKKSYIKGKRSTSFELITILIE